MKNKFKNMDKFLFLLMVLYSILGLVMVFSASSMTAVLQYGQSESYFFIRQLVYILLAYIIGFIILFIPYKWIRMLKKIPKVIAIGTMVVLLLTLFCGEHINGATSWLRIGPIQVQPSEFAKTAIILFIAFSFADTKKMFTNYKFLMPFVYAIICVALIAAQPDFVIGSADIEAQADACRTASAAGIPAALFRVDTFEDYLSMLKICTDITGHGDAYEAHGTAVKAEIEQLQTAVSSHYESGEKKVLFIRAGSQYSATKAKRAPENFVCTMLDELGTHNIADDAAILLDTLSLEEILLQDPDYIFLTTMGSEEAARSYINDLFSQDGWRHLTAVKNKQYTFLPKDLFHFKPNSRWAEAYTILADHLYPELNLYG